VADPAPLASGCLAAGYERRGGTAILAATGEELSSTGIWKLRTGRGDNPTLKTLTALATLLREGGVSRASLRTFADLPAPGRQMVEETIESVARMERDRAEGRD
jgi:ESX-1-secreted protein regulator